jgi:hypothetical protein
MSQITAKGTTGVVNVQYNKSTGEYSVNGLSTTNTGTMSNGNIYITFSVVNTTSIFV